MSSLAPQQTELYLTPTAFNGLHEKGLVIAPNPDHIARMGEIIGNELPDYALPDDMENLSLVVRGSTTIDDRRKLWERDIEWLNAAPDQLYYPGGELQMLEIRYARSVPKSSLAVPGRYVLEFSGVMPGTWGEERPQRFAEQWMARRALSSIAKNVPHEVKGTISNIPLVGSKARKVSRTLNAIQQENLNPLFVTQRHGGAIR